MNDIKYIHQANNNELNNREKLVDLMKNTLIPNDEILSNLRLYLTRQNLMSILYMNELYKKILNVNGVIMEFGVRWGGNLSLYESFRGMYEPYNYGRKIIGFDTFKGFAEIDKKDGNNPICTEGSYSVTKNYEDYLEKVLDCHEKESPISHIKKYELIKGDATKTLEKYLTDNPETIIALAYFDVYTPTKKCLELIKNHITKGTVIAFDELNHPVFKGETIALKEALGLDKYKIQRNMYGSIQSYLVIE